MYKNTVALAVIIGVELVALGCFLLALLGLNRIGVLPAGGGAVLFALLTPYWIGIVMILVTENVTKAEVVMSGMSTGIGLAAMVGLLIVSGLLNEPQLPQEALSTYRDARALLLAGVLLPVVLWVVTVFSMGLSGKIQTSHSWEQR